MGDEGLAMDRCLVSVYGQGFQAGVGVVTLPKEVLVLLGAVQFDGYPAGLLDVG